MGCIASLYRAVMNPFHRRLKNANKGMNKTFGELTKLAEAQMKMDTEQRNKAMQQASDLDTAIRGMYRKLHDKTNEPFREITINELRTLVVRRVRFMNSAKTVTNRITAMQKKIEDYSDHMSHATAAMTNMKIQDSLSESGLDPRLIMQINQTSIDQSNSLDEANEMMENHDKVVENMGFQRSNDSEEIEKIMASLMRPPTQEEYAMGNIQNVLCTTPAGVKQRGGLHNAENTTTTTTVELSSTMSSSSASSGDISLAVPDDYA